MKKITTLLSFVFLILFASSCNHEKTLQGYLVESQEKSEFITVDIPTNFLQLKSENVTTTVKETLESIRKINLVALPYKGNEDTYNNEKTILNNILNGAAYKNLMSMKAKGMQMKVYYTGSSDAIDEVIVFGYGKEKGVGVARLLGEDMNPAKIIEMMQFIKMDENALNLKQLSTKFKDI